VELAADELAWLAFALGVGLHRDQPDPVVGRVLVDDLVVPLLFLGLLFFLRVRVRGAIGHVLAVGRDLVTA
jgi:hypothetical protein